MQEKTLLRILLKISDTKPHKMRIEDFKAYKSCTSAFNYKVKTFSKVKSLKLSYFLQA